MKKMKQIETGVRYRQDGKGVRYSGSIHNTNPSFDTEKYFELIKRITHLARLRGVTYCRLFSEPRVKTGYRTKFWHCTQIAALKSICERVAPGVFNVILTEKNPNYYWSGQSVIITPNNLKLN